MRGVHVPRPDALTAYNLLRRMTVTDPAHDDLGLWLLSRFDPSSKNPVATIFSACRTGSGDVEKWLNVVLPLIRDKLTRFEARFVENLLTTKPI
jgi:hypothetical protein